jgi:TM2 domain-containing membrane protein YozV
MRALIIVALLGSTAAAEPPPITCDDAVVSPRLTQLLRARRFADVHHAAVVAQALCGDLPTTRLLDDVALLRLDDRAYALADLHAINSEPANMLLAWAYASDGDVQAAESAMARLPTPKAMAIATLAVLDDDDAFAARSARLANSGEARAAHARYRDAREKSPAFAGVLSALIPGAGQLYAGSLQAAAVTLVLNGLFIGATVELARDEHYFTAAAAGTAASFFYVGGIMNAVDLARRRNDIAQEPHREALEDLLVPELTGAF